MVTDTIDSTTDAAPAPGEAVARGISTEELADELRARAETDGVGLVVRAGCWPG